MIERVPGAALQTVEVDPDHAVGTLHDLLILVWRHETRPDAVLRASLALKALAAQHPKGVGLLQVAEVTTKPPDGPARRAVSQMLNDGQGSVLSSSLVYLGTGFWMASARAFVTGLTLLSKPAFPHVVFASVEEAAAWHARLLASDATRSAILGAVRHLTFALDQRSASSGARP